jgi:peptide/nickel transport system ATP-binding protein
MSEPALRVSNLHVEYGTPRGPAFAVTDVSFTLGRGERFSLVGESGSGKSTTVLALMRLIKPPGRVAGGKVTLGDTDVLALSEEEMRKARFQRMSLVPQGAMSSLNPVLRIREQIGDIFDAHGLNLGSREKDQKIGTLLGRVGLPRRAARLYPHELSGGMKQRVCIAMSIALSPSVILADEPTSALDVVVQKQVLATLSKVQRELGAAIILVGHDMALMAHFVDRIGVMYAGRLVEMGPVRDVFANPRHPYTRMLIGALPSLDKRGAFVGIPGVPPSLLTRLTGCPFHMRCPNAFERCRTEMPATHVAKPGHTVVCHLEDA